MDNYFYYDAGLVYPKISPYPPHEQYPEYPHDDLFTTDGAKEENKVYEAVRNTFAALRLDDSNIGKAAWNPLGKYIQPGQTVLLKPNMVNHHNPAEREFERGMDCLVPHPSVVRCLFDYVYIALRGSGKIILADAPIQGCDFELLLQNTGYGGLVSYLRGKATDTLAVQVADLREVKYTKKEGRIIQEKREALEFGSKTIDLKRESFFAMMPRTCGFRVTGYAGRDTYAHHGKNHNEYKVSDAVLEADVVVNVVKPKTHRIAGYTGALKNMIGINARKEYLPHHQKGAKGKGGDEYTDGHGMLKWFNSTGNDIKNWAIKKDYQAVASMANEFSRRIGRKLDKYEPGRKKFGMWHGNDTIWRTILDVNHIVRFADKDGIMQKHKQRKILHFGDMVACGECEGPLEPSYKKVGGILFSESAVVFDLFVVKLMGFAWKSFPVLAHAVRCQGRSTFYMQSNEGRYDKEIAQISGEDTFYFIPTKGWLEYLSGIDMES